jgi:hypothetical protein
VVPHLDRAGLLVILLGELQLELTVAVTYDLSKRRRPRATNCRSLPRYGNRVRRPKRYRV